MSVEDTNNFNSPVISVSFFLGVSGEGVKPHGTVMVGQCAKVEIVELKRERKLLQNLKSILV